jgi:hypothetical protein
VVYLRRHNSTLVHQALACACKVPTCWCGSLRSCHRRCARVHRTTRYGSCLQNSYGRHEYQRSSCTYGSQRVPGAPFCGIPRTGSLLLRSLRSSAVRYDVTLKACSGVKSEHCHVVNDLHRLLMLGQNGRGTRFNAGSCMLDYAPAQLNETTGIIYLSRA